MSVSYYEKYTAPSPLTANELGANPSLSGANFAQIGAFWLKTGAHNSLGAISLSL